MRTVKLQTMSTGSLMLVNPSTVHGPTYMVYAIKNVPDAVTDSHVMRHVNSLCLAHSLHDADAWTMEWADIERLPPWSVVNRYNGSAARQEW